MNIIFDMGSDNDKKLGLAAGYMSYLGTDKYSAEIKASDDDEITCMHDLIY